MSIAAMKQALEFLDFVRIEMYLTKDAFDKLKVVRDALISAIQEAQKAEKAGHEREPVAWMHTDIAGRHHSYLEKPPVLMLESIQPLYTHPQLSKPFAVLIDEADRDYADMRRFQALYIAADQELRALKEQPVKPLTIEQIKAEFGKLYPKDLPLIELAENNSDFRMDAIGAHHHLTAFNLGVKVAEAAHGIKEQP